jgi:hypothetical protein
LVNAVESRAMQSASAREDIVPWATEYSRAAAGRCSAPPSFARRGTGKATSPPEVEGGVAVAPAVHAGTSALDVVRVRPSEKALARGEVVAGVHPDDPTLNIAEANGSRGGNRNYRFSTALGSTREACTVRRAAVALGYVGDIDAGDAILDWIAAMLHRLGARR